MLLPDAPDYPNDEGRRQNLQQSSEYLRSERWAHRVELLEPAAQIEEGGGESARSGNEVQDEAKNGKGQRQNGTRPLEDGLPFANTEYLNLAHLTVGATAQHVFSIVQLKSHVASRR